MKVRRPRIVDAAKDIGKVRKGVNLETVAGCDEREQVGGGSAASVGASEQKILATENEVFDCSLAGIVVDVQVGVLEEARERYPVLQCICDRLHEPMVRRMFSLQTAQQCAQRFDERLRLSSANGQLLRSRLVGYGGLDFVQVSIDIQNVETVFIVAVCEHPVVEKAAARVCMASHFASGGVFEKCIEAVGGITLDHTGVAIEEGFVSGERLIGREIKDDIWVCRVSDVGAHLTFAHGARARGILYLDLSVVCFDDCRFFDFAFHELYELSCQHSRFKEPVALSGARNRGFLSSENFALTVQWESICQFRDAGVSKQPGTHVTAENRRHGFSGSNHVTPALLTRANFLMVHKFLECLRDALDLICDLVSYQFCFEETGRADFAAVLDVMMDVFLGQVLRQYVLLMVACKRFSWLPFGLDYADSRSGIAEFFVLGAELAALVFLVLPEKYVELVVEAFELLMEVSVGFQGQLQLLRQIFVRAIGLSQLQAKRGQLIALPLGLLPEGGCLIA